MAPFSGLFTDSLSEQEEERGPNRKQETKAFSFPHGANPAISSVCLIQYSRNSSRTIVTSCPIKEVMETQLWSLSSYPQNYQHEFNDKESS